MSAGHPLDAFVDALKKLVTEAVEKGLHLTTHTQQGIKALDEAHRKFWHRYPRDDGRFEGVF